MKGNEEKDDRPSKDYEHTGGSVETPTPEPDIDKRIQEILGRADVPEDVRLEIAAMAGECLQLIELEEEVEKALILSEREKSVILDNTPDIIFQVNSDGEITYINRPVDGHKKEEILGAKAEDIAPAEFVEKFISAHQAVYKDGQTVSFEFTGNSGRSYMMRYVPIYGNGSVVNAMAIATDITELKKLEARIRDDEKMKALGWLAGGIAHDFNNLMTGIMGHASILQMREKNPERLRSLDAIIKGTETGRELTQRILGFARKGQNIVQPVDINGIIGDEIEVILSRCVNERIDTRFILGAKLYTIDGDPTQINQMVMNVCINGMDAMPNGGELSISTENVSLDEHFCARNAQIKPGEFVLITITDTGEGISDEVMQHMFEPFYTTKDSPNIKGTGLGLAMVYGIVKNHGGIIEVDSVVNIGTTFRIYLPKGKKLHQQKVIPENPADEETKEKERVKTILIVDDDEHIQKVLNKMLSRAGYQTLAAEDGLEALKIFREKSGEIDCVILDMLMPNMGGKETLIEMRKIDPKVVAIVISGYGINEEVQALLDKGAKDFIAKPFTPNVILQTLKAHIQPKAKPEKGGEETPQSQI